MSAYCANNKVDRFGCFFFKIRTMKSVIKILSDCKISNMEFEIRALKIDKATLKRISENPRASCNC